MSEQIGQLSEITLDFYVLIMVGTVAAGSCLGGFAFKTERWWAGLLAVLSAVIIVGPSFFLITNCILPLRGHQSGDVLFLVGLLVVNAWMFWLGMKKARPK